MTAIPTTTPPAFALPYWLRLAARGLRGGLGGFGIFLACIALGVAAIVGVGSVAHGLGDGLHREGRRILGGDASFAVIHRELNPDERAWFSARGSISTAASLNAMARRPDGNSALISLKAVDATYPTIGDVELRPPMPIQDALASTDGHDGVVVDEALAARLELKTGDTLLVGDTPFDVRAILVSEPDRLAAGIGFGPRVLMSQDALRHTGLLAPGSLVRWLYRVSLPDAAPGQPQSDQTVDRFVASAQQAFPEAGWEARTRSNVSPQFTKNLERFTQFLTLVGLTALVVGGVGVANAVRGFVDRRRADFATLKSLGATGGTVFAASLAQVMIVALVGIAIGLVIGAALPFGVAAAFGSIIPFPLDPSVYPRELLAGTAYGVLTALAFSMGPLGRAHDVPVSALFRDRVEPDPARPRPRYLIALVLAAAALIGTIVALSTDRKLALIYIAAVFAGFVLLRVVAVGVMALARAAPHARWTELRLAVANIHRPGALTPAVVLSLGLGLALLVSLSLIDGNIRGELQRTMPGTTPSFFFLDVQNTQADTLDAFLHDHAPDAKLERVAMMRGRLVRLNDTPVDQVKAKDEAQWVLEGDRGITYSAGVPEGSVVSAGQWWPADYNGPPLVSVEDNVADGLGLKIGDAITVNVLGRNITATIGNLRKVNWRSLGINFVFVFSPNTFAGAPHTFLETATFPQGHDVARELVLLRDVANAFPAVTSVRVKDALDTLNDVMDQLAFAIRGASGVALAASVLVLAGALAAGQRARLYDAVILKTLGATRARLTLAFALEYGLLGLATAVFGVAAGMAAAWFVVTGVMGLKDWQFLWPTALTAAFGALVVTVVLGLLGTWRVLGQKPARHLKSL